MFFPYIRIVPMHVIIIAGAVVAPENMSAFYMVIFLCLKTFADMVMHVADHA